jgi:defect in organelle trafficking protein DotD
MRLGSARTIPAIVGMGLLGGCVAPNVPTDVAMTGMPNAELALRWALDQINTDMTQIGGMQPAAAIAGTASDAVVPAELQKPVRFVWSGPLDDGVRHLAASIGYAVAVSGPPHPQPILVAVNVDGPVIGAFQALGTQAGASAIVAVDPLHHQIQVIHHV